MAITTKTMPKPFSQACENNKQAIWERISRVFKPGERVLEIGTGTGQHAAYFCSQMPELIWMPSDTPDHLPTMLAGLADLALDNLEKPIVLDVRQHPWPVTTVDGVFSANCLHIISERAVEDFFAGLGEVLKRGGIACVYGPFRYKGEYTSESNEEFDQWLQARDPESGIRDYEKINALAREAGLKLENDFSMPANNQLLIWRMSS